MPVVREGEVEISRIDDLAVALATEQAPLEEVLLPAPAGLANSGGAAGRPFELDQSVEHVDRGVERRTHRPVLRLAIPAPVGEPLTDDPLDDRGDVHAEVGAGLDGPTVDARLDLTVEVSLAGVFPTPVLGNQRDGVTSSFGRRVEPDRLQRLQRVHRRRPRLPGLASGVGARKAGAAVPQTVGTLERQQAGAPALADHPPSLGSDHVRRGAREIA